MLKRKKEGKPLPETADMKIWREEFDQMSSEDHHRVLKNLGLDDEDIDDFDADISGKSAEEAEEEVEEKTEDKNSKTEKGKKSS